MPRFFIFVPAQNLYVANPTRDGKYPLTLHRQHAGLFKEDDVERAASIALQTATPQIRMEQATPSELKGWSGRQGGKNLTLKKRRALKRIARRERPGSRGNARAGIKTLGSGLL